jgi:hypothetical protein
MRFRGSMLTQGTLTTALAKTQEFCSRLPTPVKLTRHLAPTYESRASAENDLGRLSQTSKQEIIL